MLTTTVKKINALLMTALLLFLVSACGGDRTSSPVVPPADQPSIIDRDGKAIALPDKVDKIISMAPSITETLVHLGLADKLVAVDKYSANISGVPDNLPTYDMMSPDSESIAALRPDIIFATGMSKSGGDDPFKPVTDLGILMTYIPSPESIGGIKEDIRFIGKVTRTEAKAENIIKEMEKEIDGIIEKIDGMKSGKAAYFEVAAAPGAYSFGKGTSLHEIIELLGASNILADQNSWVSVSEETVIKRNPDIIFTNVDYIDDPVADILDRNGWDAINAVKNRQVYLIDKDSSSRFNEYITVAFEQMAKALYHEAFE